MENTPMESIPTPEPAGVFTLFSPRGRLGRKQYFYIVAASAIGAAILFALLNWVPANSAVIGASAAAMEVAAVCLSAACGAVVAMASIRRMHDMGRPGIWALLALIPLAPVVLMFLPGTQEPNRFGEHRRNVHLYWNAPLVALLPALLLARVAMDTFNDRRDSDKGVPMWVATDLGTPRPTPTPRLYADDALGYSLSVPYGWLKQKQEAGDMKGMAFQRTDERTSTTAMLIVEVVPVDTEQSYEGLTKEQLDEQVKGYLGSMSQSGLKSLIPPQLKAESDIKAAAEAIGDRAFLHLQWEGTLGGSDVYYHFHSYQGYYNDKRYVIETAIPTVVSEDTAREADAIVQTFRILPIKK